MAISEAARDNHDAMFPHHRSTLKLTDPELVEVFDNWAFGEVMRDAPLDSTTRLMVQLAAIITCQAPNEEFEKFGIALPLPGQSTTTPDDRMERGLQVQKGILGDRVDQLYAQAPHDQLHIQRYLTGNCFGDYVTRNGLDLTTRELLTLSMLAAHGGCESQLAGHVAANLAVGNGHEVLINTITQLLPFIGYPRSLNALKVITDGAST